MREVIVSMLSIPRRHHWPWWVLVRWTVLLLVVVFADAQRGRCYASRAALGPHSPHWHSDSDFIPDQSSAMSAVRGHHDTGHAMSEQSLHSADSSALARTRRNPWQQTEVWFINLVERGNVSMELKGQFVDLRYIRLGFGDTRKNRASVTINDRVHVAEYYKGQVVENKTRHVNSDYPVIPANSIWFVVSYIHQTMDESQIRHGSLAVVTLVQDLEHIFQNAGSTVNIDRAHQSNLFVFSTFMTTVNVNVDSGIDIWGLRRDVDENGITTFKIVRLLNGLVRHDAVAQIVDAGVYEIKVYLHNTIEKQKPFRLTHFKNIPSLIPDTHRYIELKPRQRTTLIIGGQLDRFHHRKLLAIPRHEVEPFRYPKIKFMVFNGIPIPPSQRLEMGFMYSLDKNNFEVWTSLAYKQMGFVDVEAKQNDPYTMGIVEGTKIVHRYQQWPIRSAVSFHNGHCIMFADQEEAGSPTSNFLCVEDDGTPHGLASWMVLYHGLVNYTGALDIFFKTSGSPQHVGSTPTIHVMTSAYKSFAITNITSGLYLVKVAPAKKILWHNDFDLVDSLVEEACVNLTGTYPEVVSVAMVHGSLNAPPGSLSAPVFSMRNSNGAVNNVDMVHCKPPKPPCRDCFTTAAPTTTPAHSGAAAVGKLIPSCPLLALLTCSLCAFLTTSKHWLSR